MADLNQPANTENWLEEPKKLPSMLNVLTILTFIGNGLGFFSAFYSFFSAASNYDKIVQAQDQPDPQVRKIIPPPTEQIQLLVLPAVKQIPDNQQLPRLKILDQGE